MAQRLLGTLTIGQAPRADITPIIESYVPAAVRRVHRGVLDGLPRGEIDARYRPAAGEAVLVTPLLDGSVIELSRQRIQHGAQVALAALEAEGCDAILLLCTGTFTGLTCKKAWLIEPDHIIPGMVAGLVGHRQLGIVVPVAAQVASESGKWKGLVRSPLFAVASPYHDEPEALVAAGVELKKSGAAAILLDCIGFIERHRAALQSFQLPVFLSNTVVAKALGELFGS